MPAIPAASALLRLTPRDRALITVLSELRYLTAAQIQQVCYPTITVAGTSHRLTLLRHRGVLDCLSHRAFADRRVFWGLTARGRAAAAALAGVPPDRVGTAVAALQMEHLIATNQVFCDLCREHRGGRLPSFRWVGSHHAHVDLGHTHLIPDALMLFASPDGAWWMYCLELDRHTMPESALIEKFERYALMQRIAAARLDDSLWEARADAWVVFACGDERRAAAAVRQAAGCGLARIWAGTVDRCAAALAAAIGPQSGVASVGIPLPPCRRAPVVGIDPPTASGDDEPGYRSCRDDAPAMPQ